MNPALAFGLFGATMVLLAWLHYTERISHGSNPHSSLDSIFAHWLLGLAFIATGFFAAVGLPGLAGTMLFLLGIPGFYILAVVPRWTQPQWRRDQIEAHEAARRASKADRRKRR